MRTKDVIVIGGGLAGLIAAITAAGRGKQVTLMTLGAGMLAIGGGSIDIMGYVDNKPVDNFRSVLANLPERHPYSKVGKSIIEEAVKFFLTMCSQEGFNYTGSLDATKWLPTAVGTLKPSCLVPLTMDPAALKTAKNVVVAGFVRLKDYFPELISKGLTKIRGYDKNYQLAIVDPGFSGGRDVTTLDIARWLDTAEGQLVCREQLAGYVGPDSIIIIPPVLGSRPDYVVKDVLEQALKCRFVEAVVMPAAITGLRLRRMLLSRAKKMGVRIIEQAHVTSVLQQGNRVTAVITSNIDRQRTYHTQAVVMATGGFLGGGLTAGPDYVREAIFDLPVDAPADREQWGRHKLFSGGAQPFAEIGITVDSSLRPIALNGQVILENVYIAGRSLAGYDYCQEKSGNGVALVTGYKAGINC